MRLRAGICVALAAMVAVSAWQRWHVLAATPYPAGIDGYFYAIQLRTLLAHGHLAYPASPLTFWWMAPFAAITDPITGAKLGAAIGGALVALPAYGVGKRLGECAGAGLIAAAVATASAGSTYLSLEFVKQGVGLTVALAALWALLAALERPTRARVIVAVVAVVATMFAHKLATVVLAITAVPAVVAGTRAHLFGRRRIYAAIALAAVLAAVAVTGAAMPRRFPSLADLGLLRDLVGDAQWSAPALVAPGATLSLRHEALIGGILGLCAAAVLWRRRRRRNHRGEAVPVRVRIETTVAWSLVALAIAIALPWLDVTDPQGLGFRLRTAAFVPMALCAAIVATAGASTLARLAKHRDAVLAGLAVLVFALGIALPDHRRGEVVTPAVLANAVARVAGKIPPNTTIIVPDRRIMFMAQWYTGAPVSLRPEPIPYAHRVRLFGHAFINEGLRASTDGPLDAALDAARLEPTLATPPINFHDDHRNGLVLVTEPTWDWLMAHVPPQTREHFTQWITL